MGICKDTKTLEEMITRFFIFKRIVLPRIRLRQEGRRADRTVYAFLPLIYGTAEQRKGMKRLARPMTCLIAAMLRISLRQLRYSEYCQKKKNPILNSLSIHDEREKERFQYEK